MRICIMANPNVVHTRRWAQALKERGHEVSILSIRSADLPGIPVHTVCVGPANSTGKVWTLLSYLWLLLSARRVLEQISPDVVNAHFSITNGAIAAFSGYRPRVVNAWGSDVVWNKQGAMPWWKKALNRWAFESADTAVSTSRYMVDAMRKFLKKPITIEIVPFGVDVTKFRPDQAPEKPREDSGKSEFRIGFVKTLRPIYAPENLIRAAPMILERVPNAKFLIAGKGPMRHSLENLVAELGIERHVDFLGYVPHDDVPVLMRGLDVLVNCSKWESEFFGVVLCEASASGVATVATDVGGVRETVLHGKTGLLVPPDDPEQLAEAVCKLAEDPNLRADMARNGREFVIENYEWSKNVSRFEEILLETQNR